MQNHSDFVAGSFASEKRILFAKLALKNFHRLNNHRLRKRIDMRIRQLAIHPYPQNCKKLKAAQNLWEISQGSYRIWYEPRCAANEIEIVWIGHHQDDYRKPNFMKRVA
jgi:mRNA-degrading endonuclease RelE of RelBE toxin-antitoxin system